MSKVDFVELLGSKKRDRGVNPMVPGSAFPGAEEWLNGRSPIVCSFLSFACSTCIDLLPHIAKLAEEGKGQFVLFTDGSAEENASIVDYFGFGFPVNSITYSSFKSVYRVPETPFIYTLNEAGKVTGWGVADTGGELAAIIHKATARP